MRLRATHRLEPQVLKHPQQLHLHGRRGGGDLVEKDGAAVGLQEFPVAVRGSAGEGTGHVAKKFAFEQRLAETAAGHLDEPLPTTPAGPVDLAGQQRFARAALARDEQRRRRIGEAGHKVEHVLHRRRHAEQFWNDGTCHGNSLRGDGNGSIECCEEVGVVGRDVDDGVGVDARGDRRSRGFRHGDHHSGPGRREPQTGSDPGSTVTGQKAVDDAGRIGFA